MTGGSTREPIDLDWHVDLALPGPKVPFLSCVDFEHPVLDSFAVPAHVVPSWDGSRKSRDTAVAPYALVGRLRSSDFVLVFEYICNLHWKTRDRAVLEENSHRNLECIVLAPLDRRRSRQEEEIQEEEKIQSVPWNEVMPVSLACPCPSCFFEVWKHLEESEREEVGLLDR
jgi:hypothetical protein